MALSSPPPDHGLFFFNVGSCFESGCTDGIRGEEGKPDAFLGDVIGLDTVLAVVVELGPA